MKYLFSFLFVFSLAFIFSSCDDSGNVNINGNGTFTALRLKTLNPNVEGVYELWVSFNTPYDHGENDYISMGRFNIDATGNVVDTSGGPVSFSLKRQPSNLLDAGDAIVTIRQPGNFDTIPSGTKIMGGPASLSADFINFSLSMSYEEVLGDIAVQFASDSCKYILNTPSTPDTLDYFRGIWLTTDVNGTTTGMTSRSIPDSLGWIYEGWVYNTGTQEFYNTGKFSNPGTGSSGITGCGTTGAYNKPGVELLDSNCTNNAVVNLNNGNWRFMVTLEPIAETNGNITPFYLKIFDGPIGVAGYRAVGAITNSSSVNLPTGTLTISRN